MTEDISRPDADKNIATEPKNRKAKNKARLQLWDSLLDVYAEEADKENLSDCEEIEIREINKWPVKNRGDILRGQVKLAETNPQLIITAIPGTINIGNEERSRAKRENKITPSLNSCPSFKSSKLVKNEKIDSNIKNTLKTNVKRKQVQKKKLKEKLPLNPLNPLAPSLSSLDVKYKHREYKKTEDNLKHKCKVTLRYHNENPNIVKRADRRVFNCKLVFRVSECCESDELF